MPPKARNVSELCGASRARASVAGKDGRKSGCETCSCKSKVCCHFARTRGAGDMAAISSQDSKVAPQLGAVCMV